MRGKRINRQAVLQDQIDACGAWELDRRIEIAIHAMKTRQQGYCNC